MSRRFCIFVYCLFSSAAGFAGPPQYITIQGKLVYSNDEAVVGQKQVVFTLYNALSGGSNLWQETDTVDIDKFGLYNVTLGKITSLSILDFNTPYWLEIRVDGETFSPRYEIVSSPYAINSERLGGQTSGYYLNYISSAAVSDAADTTLTRTGVGTIASPYKLQVNLGNTNTWTGSQTFNGGLVCTGCVDNSDLAGSIADSKLNQISTTDKVAPAAIAAGNLLSTVIASSIAVNGVYPAAVRAGTYGINITGTSAGAAPTGTAGGDLSGSFPNPSIASLPAISGANLTNLTAANISAGVLGASVIASSVAVGAVTNANLTGPIAYSKLNLTGAILNADLAGSIAPAKITGTAAILGANTFTGVQTCQAGIDVTNGNVTVADTLQTAKAVVTNTTSSRFHVPALTTADLQIIAPIAAGDLYYNTNLKAVCVSTGTGTFAIVQSSSPATPCQ